MTSVIPTLLFIGGGLALLLAVGVQRRHGAPGVRPFGWLCGAVAVWCIAGGFHAIANALTIKLFWAQVQYAGIVSVPPLWLLFAAEYAGVGWMERAGRRLLWIAPAATLMLALTNDRHHAIWTDVQMTPGGQAIYSHGWWFWGAAAYNYVLVLGGTLLLVQALRRSPPIFRGQILAVIIAAIVPWAGNLAYVLGLLPSGFDATSLAFTASGGLLAWALYMNHLFDLVPVARDMVVDSLEDAVIVVDSSRRILDMNARAQRLVQAERRWIGQPFDTVVPWLSHTVFDAAAHAPDMRIMPTPHGHRYYDVRVMPVRSRAGRLAAWAVLLRDVTDQRRAADERDAFQARVQEQQRREGLSILAAGLAHDFNNLLAGIVGNADLLAMQVPAASDMSSNVGAILLGAQRAADLVSKMLAYAGERHGTSGRIDLDQLVREMLDLLRASAGRHCTIEYRGEPTVIQGDSTQVRQVAMNLIINAAEAVDESTGVVTVTVGSTSLSGRQLADMQFGQDATPGLYAFLEVRDNGHGMDTATLQRIFQPFFTTKSDGHGLGLAAVQGIVLGHRGALRVETRTGSGSRFCVWFPHAGVIADVVSLAAS